MRRNIALDAFTSSSFFLFFTPHTSLHVLHFPQLMKQDRLTFPHSVFLNCLGQVLALLTSISTTAHPIPGLFLPTVSPPSCKL